MIGPIDDTTWMIWIVAFATAVLSAIVGMAGGITLLAVMLLFLPPLVVIPLHGMIQLASNGSRAWIQRRHVEPSILWRFALPLLPFGALAIGVARSIPEDPLRVAIGVFVLLATWRPRWLLLGASPEHLDPHRRFLGLGAVAGAANVTIGATGPLIAPFFLELGMTRQALVGTKAACQMAGHLAKIVLFGAMGFAFGDHLVFLTGAVLAVVAGTWVGSRILDRVSERAFVTLYRSVLTLIAVRLVIHPLVSG